MYSEKSGRAFKNTIYEYSNINDARKGFYLGENASAPSYFSDVDGISVGSGVLKILVSGGKGS